ncbi:unnamed protein product [Rhodiola kirilowii]
MEVTMSLNALVRLPLSTSRRPHHDGSLIRHSLVSTQTQHNQAKQTRHSGGGSLVVHAKGKRGMMDRSKRPPAFSLPKLEDDGNPKFVIFIRMENVYLWYPLSVITGGTTAKIMVAAKDNILGKYIYKGAIDRNLAAVIYKMAIQAAYTPERAESIDEKFDRIMERLEKMMPTSKPESEPAYKKKSEEFDKKFERWLSGFDDKLRRLQASNPHPVKEAIDDHTPSEPSQVHELGSVTNNTTSFVEDCTNDAGETSSPEHHRLVSVSTESDLSFEKKMKSVPTADVDSDLDTCSDLVMAKLTDVVEEEVIFSHLVNNFSSELVLNETEVVEGKETHGFANQICVPNGSISICAQGVCQNASMGCSSYFIMCASTDSYILVPAVKVDDLSVLLRNMNDFYKVESSLLCWLPPWRGIKGVQRCRYVKIIDGNFVYDKGKSRMFANEWQEADVEGKMRVSMDAVTYYSVLAALNKYKLLSYSLPDQRPPSLPPENDLKIDVLDEVVAELENGVDSLFKSFARFHSQMLSVGQNAGKIRDHAEIIQVMLKPTSDVPLQWAANETRHINLTDIGIFLPLLVFVPHKKRSDESVRLPQEYNIWCWTKCWDLALSSIQKGLVLSSNRQGQLNTIKADAKGSKEEIYSSRVKYMFKEDQPYIWVPEDNSTSLSNVTANMQQLSLEKDEHVQQVKEETCIVVISDHLQVQSSECLRLTFGSFGAGIAAGLAGTSTADSLNSDVEEQSETEDASAVDHSDFRNPKYQGDGQYRLISPENLINRGGVTAETHESISPSQPELLKQDIPSAAEGAHYTYHNPLPGYNLNDSHRQQLNPAFAQSQTNSQTQNPTLFLNAMAYTNLSPGELLASSVQEPVRESDLYSKFQANQLMAMAAKFGNAASVVGSSASGAGPLEISNVSSFTQVLPRANVAGPCLPPHLAMHRYLQPTLPLGPPFSNMISYPFCEQLVFLDDHVFLNVVKSCLPCFNRIGKVILHTCYASGSKKDAHWVTKPPPMPPDVLFINTLLTECKMITKIHRVAFKVVVYLVEVRTLNSNGKGLFEEFVDDTKVKMVDVGAIEFITGNRIYTGDFGRFQLASSSGARHLIALVPNATSHRSCQLKKLQVATIDDVSAQQFVYHGLRILEAHIYAYRWTANLEKFQEQFIMFSSPRPPEVADLEDKVNFMGRGMLRNRILGNLGEVIAIDDEKEIQKTAFKQYRVLRSAKEFRYGYKLVENNNLRSALAPNDVIELPTPDKIKSVVDKVKDFFGDAKESFGKLTSLDLGAEELEKNPEGKSG